LFVKKREANMKIVFIGVTMIERKCQKRTIPLVPGLAQLINRPLLTVTVIDSQPSTTSTALVRYSNTCEIALQQTPVQQRIAEHRRNITILEEGRAATLRLSQLRFDLRARLTKGISSLDLRKECNKELQEIGEDDYYADAEYFELCILFLLAEIEELEMQDMQDHGMPVDECLPPLSAGTDTLARNKTLSPELKNALIS
jgi:hypothetical protein